MPQTEELITDLASDPTSRSAEVLVVEPRETARRTLAMRIEHRNRLRAERLARLRADVAPNAAEQDETGPRMPDAQASSTDSDEAKEDAASALEEFLWALSQGNKSAAPPAEPAKSSVEEPAPVLQFQRSEETETSEVVSPERVATEPLAAPICDLDRLPGVGPGLIWAMRRAGVHCLQDLASCDSAELTDRLGPIGRLIPLERWIELGRSLR